MDHPPVLENQASAAVPNVSEYERKVRILNEAMQEIGMGRYQWALFFVTGFGYFADNLWPIVTGLILPAVVNEFKFNAPFVKLGQNIGLLVGAVFWGVGADVWGRKLSFNATLLITGVFAVSAGGSQNYATLSALAAAWSVGVGGNLPVDSAIFLEFVPATHQYLLTVLSIWWSLGQLIGSLIAWPLLTRFSCPTPTSTSISCRPEANKGWRYFLFIMGALMLLLWAIRFFAFEMHESPKYLLGKGKEAQAVEVVKRVARVNGKTCSLVLEDLLSRGVAKEGREGKVEAFVGDAEKVVEVVEKAVKEGKAGGGGGSVMAGLDFTHVKALFATKEEARSTCLLVALWALIGLAFPLYNSFVTYFLSTRGVQFGDGSTYTTYRNQVILSTLGVPGSIISGYMVELPVLGRRGTLAIFTALTGVFILGSTTARTSNALLGWNSAYSFTSNVMYGVLYAITPELFPTKDRGTGNALTAAANRVFGVMAPIIALYADLSTSVPIYISGSIFLVCGILALLLPKETRGKAAL
ncbi:MFS general substrate transporter [Pholiota conissans]|uniref:MFS general substrate transporter n=1 Tax=Pholiota conissans TaxID=109636 RepID=A0A9P5Z3C4_9AGAR|nr:MFS general substrate transporter [Pholiota conissans]